MKIHQASSRFRTTNRRGDTRYYSIRPVNLAEKGGTGQSRRFQGLLTVVTIVAVLVLGFSHNGVTHADSLPVVDESGTLTSDETWTPDNVYVVGSGLTVPDGITLTIDAGTIIKYAPNFALGSNAINVDAGGTLDAEGTSEAPIFFTSLRDDSIGGDSAGDGATSGAIDDYSDAINMEGGTVDVAHATFEYAAGAVSGGSGSDNLTITDSTLRSLENGIFLTGGSQSVTLQRNDFDLGATTNEYAIYLEDDTDLSGIVLSGADENTFTGSAHNVTIEASDSDVPSGSTWTIDADSGVILETTGLTYVHGTLALGAGTIMVDDEIQVAGTLTMADGVIVKAPSSGSISVNPGGTFDATGTSENPVIFTSLKDDSVGGDTAGDGSTTGAIDDYSGDAIEVSGTADIAHAIFENGTQGIEGGNGSSITVTDSSFEHIESAMNISGGTENVVLQRNNINLGATTNEYAMYLEGIANLSDIVLSGADENTFTGAAHNVTVEVSSSDLPSGSTWTVDTSSGVILGADTLNTIEGTLDLDSGVTLVDSGDTTPLEVNGGTLTMADGVVVKSIDSGSITVTTGGTFDATGTSENPIIFTSLNDDSVGGDTAGDGSTIGAIGDYNNLLDQVGGTVNLTDATIKYASEPIETGGDESQANFEGVNIEDANEGVIANGGLVAFRGTFTDVSGKYIEEDCDWGNTTENCSVDAAYNNWGSVDGPFASDPTDDKVCGVVTVSPWVYDDTDHDSTELYHVQNCDGSETLDTKLDSAISSFESGVASAQSECDGLGEDTCDAVNTAYDCLSAAATLAGEAYGSIPMPDETSLETGSGVTAGLLSGTSSVMRTQEVSLPTGDLSDFGSAILGVANLFVNIYNAYNTCNP